MEMGMAQKKCPYMFAQAYLLFCMGKICELHIQQSYLFATTKSKCLDNAHRSGIAATPVT